MYDNFFYDHTCSIYSITKSIIWGAEKKSKVVLYDGIPCALWSIDSNNLTDTAIGRQWDTATHKINIDWQYSSVEIWRVFVIDNREYYIVDMVKYNDIDDLTDNISFYVRVR